GQVFILELLPCFLLGLLLRMRLEGEGLQGVCFGGVRDKKEEDMVMAGIQRIRDEDRLTAHIQHEHDSFRDLVRAAKAEPQDGPDDAGSSCCMDLLSLFSYLKIPPKKKIATTTTTTTPMTDAQLKALIAKVVADALEEIKANRTNRNGDDNHDSGTSSKRTKRAAREYTYIDFLKYQPLNFKESDEVKKYAGGLPKMIHGNVMDSKPKTMQDQIEFATELMDQKIRNLAERQAEKRKFKDTSRNNQNQQQPFKRHNVARAYTCAPKCTNCKRTGHSAQDCRSQPAAANNNQRAQRANQRENQAGNGNAVARAYGVDIAGTNSNSNIVTGTFLLNNRYALILFDTSADRSFMSTTFSSLIDIIPTTLDHGYDVELADGRII
nr:hypothetical protein [Tanacetum cinerariifolium]